MNTQKYGLGRPVKEFRLTVMGWAALIGMGISVPGVWFYGAMLGGL